MNTARMSPQHAAVDRQSTARLVQQFHDDVRADDLLSPTFDAVLGERWATRLPRMVEFWSTVLAGSRRFTGNVFGKHMAVAGVTPQHFGRWLTLWIANTNALFDTDTATQMQQVASGIARNLYRGYFGPSAGFDGIESELRHARP